MTGYFSQLAHHTGISVEPGSASVATSPVTASAVANPHVESASVISPHVEEIAFTAPHLSSAFEGSEGLTGVSPVDTKPSKDDEKEPVDGADNRNAKHIKSKDAGILQHSVAVTTTSIDVFPGTSWEESRIEFVSSESVTRNLRECLADEQTTAHEQRIAQSDKRSSLEHQADAVSENRQPSRLEVKHADQGQPLRAREHFDSVRDEPNEREAIIGNYMKEVRTWVAAPLEFNERDLIRERDAERPLGSKDVFALEPEIEPTVPRPGRPETLQVQDLNLSIGTITVVIEEPKKTAPTVLPAPPRVDRSSEHPANEPTQLSRYYLGRW